VTADPNHAGVAYQVWDRIDQIASGPAAIYNGPAFISTTRDHGRTWSTPRVFVDTSVIPNSQTLGNVIVPDARRHALYDFFEWQTYSDTTANTVTDLHFAFVKSTDEGRTWSKPTKIANDSSTLEVDPNAPNDPAKALRAGNNLISAAIDPQTGELYAAYEGTDFSGGAFNQIELVHSTDHGATWSAPARISQVPNTPAFTPSIAVDTNGTVALTYYDLRYLQPGDTTTLPTAAWYLTFPRGGEAFPSERQISAVFDWLQAPFATWGHFLGDYASVAVLGHEQFRPLFAESFAIPGNPTDVYSNVFGSGFAPTTPKAARDPRSDDRTPPVRPPHPPLATHACSGLSAHLAGSPRRARWRRAGVHRMTGDAVYARPRPQLTRRHATRPPGRSAPAAEPAPPASSSATRASRPAPATPWTTSSGGNPLPSPPV
jgi:hypothetical protein